MKLDELYRSKDFVLSFELFPPKTDASMADLREQLAELIAHGPDFITCTYGAGGGTRDRTLQTLRLVAEMTGLPLATHLTCVGMPRDDLRAYLQAASDQGIQYIVALRGDPPKGDTEFKPVADGFRYGSELVAFIREEFPQFGVAVAAYPEVHPDALSAEDDLRFLKQKVDAGADAVMTQLFYENDLFLRFRDKYAAAEIPAPLVPGLLPITSYAQVQRIMKLSGSELPPKLEAQLEAVADDTEAQYKVGVEWATRQAEDLKREGVPGIHFYVLNKSRATSQVVDALNGKLD